MARKAKETKASDPDGLTDKQRLFIDLYLGECKFNASKAALKAGYATRQEGATLKANPVIRARIDAHLARNAMKRDEVLEMLADDALNDGEEVLAQRDRKSTRLNSSHVKISYAVFCLKKKMKT